MLYVTSPCDRAYRRYREPWEVGAEAIPTRRQSSEHEGDRIIPYLCNQERRLPEMGTRPGEYKTFALLTHVF